MKQEFDREMDSLLRGALGGARVASPRPADGAAAHLSADELSAFAENALPPAARARYTSHIADCDQCRRVVAGITLAAGPSVVREERASPATVVPERRPSWLAAWAGALLSPGVLRFALPVLAVALVGVVGLVVMRNRGENTQQVTRQMPADVQNKTSITEPARPTDISTAPASPAPNMATGAGDYARAGTNQSAAGERAEPLTAATTTKEEAGAKLAPVLKDGQATDALTAESAPALRNEAKQAAPPKPAEVAADRPAPAAPVAAAPSTASAQQRPLTREAQEEDKRKAAVGEVAKAEEREEPRQDEGSRRRAGETRSGPSRRMENLAGSRTKSRDEDDAESEYKVDSSRRGVVGGRADKPDEERRSVAGREFRRRGGEWVDVNYKGGMTPSSYKRGSEGFRALVADIPEIGRVAEQLQGAFVVVVRGRAYRIH